MLKSELENLVQTQKDTIEEKDRTITYWKNLAEKNVDSLKVNKENEDLLKEVRELRESKNVFEKGNIQLLEYKEHNKKLVDTNTHLVNALNKYTNAFKAFMLNIQGGLENAVEYNALLDAVYKPKPQQK